mgnify:CR=1 FL=1
MATVSTLSLKIDPKVRIIRATWWPLLVAIGRLAIRLGADENRVLDRMTPLAGVVTMKILGRRHIYLLRRRDGQFELREIFR